MNLKPFIQRLQDLEQRRHPPKFIIGFQEDDTTISINGESMDEVEYEVWLQQQPPNTKVVILSWSYGDDDEEC
jgi:hypothetical protein